MLFDNYGCVFWARVPYATKIRKFFKHIKIEKQ